jgi:hypothetical protein
MGSPVSNSSAVSRVDFAETRATTQPKKQSAFSKGVSKIAEFYPVKQGLDFVNKNRISLSAGVLSALVLGPLATLAVVGVIAVVRHLIDEHRTPNQTPGVLHQ